MNSKMLESRCIQIPRVLDYIQNELRPYTTIESTMSDMELMKFSKIFVLRHLLDVAMLQPFYDVEGDLPVQKPNNEPKLFGLFGSKPTYVHQMAPAQYILERFVYQIYNPEVFLKQVAVDQKILDANGHINRNVKEMISHLDRFMFTMKVKENSFDYDIYKLTYRILEEDTDAIDNLFSAKDIGKHLDKIFQKAIRSNQSDAYLVTDWSQKLAGLV